MGTRGALDVSYSYLPHYFVLSLLLLAFRNEPSWVGSTSCFISEHLFHLVVGGKAAALLCSIYPMRERRRLGCWSDMGCF